MKIGIGPRADSKRHALVIGGSMAGALAARVLANQFEQVTVLERDGLRPGPVDRAGVPHARQLHVMLRRGLDIVEALFPGIEQALVEAGASLIDAGRDFRVLYPSGWSPRFTSGLTMLALTRALLESTVRARLSAVPGVTIRSRARVDDLLFDSSGSRVLGACIGDEIVEADLIVDASGRRSQVPSLVEKRGYERPIETVVDARWGYASRVYRRPRDRTFDWKQLLILFDAPSHTRVGVLQPIEGDRWLVNVAGVMGDHPPTSEEGFMEFVSSLRSSELFDAIRGAEPLGNILGFRHTENRLRHFERLARWPRRLVVLGDAVCSFNPVYGQGMTVAAIEAVELGAHLSRRRALDDLTPGFQRAVARIVAGPFMLATSEDSRWPETSGARSDAATRFMHWYIDRIISRIPSCPSTAARFQRVQHMVAEPITLFRPEVFLRAMLGPKSEPPSKLTDGDRAVDVFE